MKRKIKISWMLVTLPVCMTGLMLLNPESGRAQDSTAAVTEEKPGPVKVKPVKNTFQSVWIGDEQTVLVPIKGSMEMDIQHRFGTVNNGFEDLWGFFAPSNIRLGLSYAPINKLFVGMGLTKDHRIWDASLKYSFFTQTKGKYPVSVTYYGNIADDTRKDPDGSLFKYQSQRLSFFNQIIIARKVTDKLSVQVAPSVTHQNSVDGYYTKNDSTGKDLFQYMKHNHIAIAFSVRYKLTNVTSVMFNYDQPITKHATNNPNPNMSLGIEFNTSSHSFQFFLGNYFMLSPQRNNLFNDHSPFGYKDATGAKVKGGEFLIGFNITRLWNY